MPLVPDKQEYEAVVTGPGQTPGTEIEVGRAPLSAGEPISFDLPDPEPAVVTSLRQAAGVNPDAAARAIRLQDAAGVPVQQTMEDKDLADLAAHLPDLKALQANQGTSLFLQAPRNAAVAKDDVQTLTGFERTLRLFADGYHRSQITNRMYQAAYDLMQAGGKDENLLAEVRRLEKEAQATLQPQGWLEEAGAGAVEFATQMGLGLLEAAPSGLVGAAAGSIIPGVGTAWGAGVGMTVGMTDYMRRLEAGSAYWQYVNEGVPHESAQLGAGLAGMVNAAVESLQVGQAVKAFPGGKALLQKGLRTAIKEALSSPKLAGVLKNFALRQGKFTLEETAEEGIQQLVTDAVGEYLKGTPYSEWWNNIAPDVAETMRRAGLGIGALGLLGHGAGLVGDVRAAKRFSPDAAKVVEAVENLNQGKLAQRSPQALEEFVEGVVKETNTPTRVYFDPAAINTLFQTQEIMPEDAADVLERAGVNMTDFNERMGLGLPVAMEVKKLPGFLATTIGQAVKGSITYAPEVIENKALMRLAEESGLPMPTELMAQAEARFREIGASPAVAKTWAALLGARARVVASLTGMDPNDYLTQGPYKWVFQKEGGEAGSQNQLFQPLNADVDLDQPMKIVQAEPKFDGRKPHDLNKGEGRRKLKESIVGVYTNRATGWDINLSSTNAEHAISTATTRSPVNEIAALEAVANLPALIENAVLVETHPDVKGEAGLKQMHRFFAAFGLGSRLYAAKITVKEFEKGIYADLEGIYSAYDASLEKEVPDGIRQASPAEAGTPGSTPGTDISLRQLLDGVKDHLGEPYTLFQDRVKGAVTFDEGQAIITLFKHADPTTLPHEAFHVFRREMEIFATDPYIPRTDAARQRQERLKEDYRLACEFVGAKVGEAWTREQEEAFAKTGERYLLKGEVPVPALRGLFARMRQWFLDLYKAIKDSPNSELSDEMRGVFDRLLATDQDIKLAKAQELAAPTITKEPAQADPAWWKIHQRQAAKAARSAEDNIAQKRMGEVTQNLRKWRDEAAEAAREHPGQRLLADIMAQGGLNHAALALAYDPQVIAQLRQKRVGLVRKEGGISLENLARQRETTRAELLTTILNTPNQAQLIKAYIYARQMEAENGLTAEELAITDSALELQRMEADYLAGQAPGVERADIDAPAREFEATAHEEVQALAEEDPATVRAAMSKEAQIAKEAYLAGDMARAAEAKKKQMAAAARLRERLNSRREIAGARAYFERVVRAGTSGEYSPAGIEDSYLQQIRAILSRYLDLPRGILPRSGIPALTDFLAEMPEAIRPQIAAEILEGIGDYAPVPMAKLKFGALMNLKDAITALETMGKNEKLLISFEKNVEFGAARDEIWRTIEDNNEVKPPPEAPAIWKNISPAKRALAWVNKFLVANTKVEFILRRLDGFKDLGEVQKYLFGQIKRAEDRQIRFLQEADRRLKAAFEAVPAEIRNKWSKKRLTPEIPQGELTGEQIVMVGLNSGNKGNREATRLGWGWSKEGYEAVLARIAPEEWRLIYEVWGILEDVFPLIDDTHYKMFGTHLERVIGNYFPLVFDRRASWKAEQFQQAEAEHDFWQNTYASPATRRGFTIARKGGKLPPLLEFSVITRHLYDTIHHATHALAVRDVYKLISDPLVKNTIIGAVGEDAYKQIMPWLQEVARPDRGPVNILENIAGYVRAGYTAAVLGYAIQTVIQQPLAVFNAMPELGFLNVLKGMAKLGPETSEFIKEKSAYMSQRRQAMDREIKSRLQAMPPTAELHQKLTGEWAYAMMGFTDQLAAQSVWLAAYDQGMKQHGGDEVMAVDHADGVVRRTQGSAMAKDLPAIQRGSEFTKAGTMFLTFFNSVFNLMQEAGHKFASDHEFLDLAKSYWWIVVVPAVLGSMAIERERWKPKDALLALITYPMTVLPFLREAGSLVNALAGDRGFDYRGGPLGAVFQGGVEAARALSADDIKARTVIKKAAPVVGALTKLPTNQAMVTMEGILDMLEWETKNPMHLLLRRRKERNQ